MDTFNTSKYWQKNFRTLPDHITKNLGNSGNIQVGCVKTIPHSHILEGRYAHLGISIENGEIQFEESVLPSPSKRMRYSRWNVHGREIVRRDLSKITIYFSVESPNWGDPDKGMHINTLSVKKFPRDFIPPKELDIGISLLQTNELKGESTYSIKFFINEVIDQANNNAQADIFFAANLLQENTGACGIFPANADDADYLRTIHVDWEILPPGKREETIAHILGKYTKKENEQYRGQLESRYKLLEVMKPLCFINGTSGFRRYFGAKLAEDFVVFENLEYGNAIYVMFNDWQSLSKLSRLQLWNAPADTVIRIVHKNGWENRLIAVVTNEKEKRRLANLSPEEREKEHAKRLLMEKSDIRKMKQSIPSSS